jgi:hypothetical protein
MDLPSSGRAQAIGSVRVVIATEGHAARDKLKTYGGLNFFGGIHIVIYDEAQQFGDPEAAVPLTAVAANAIQIHVGDKRQPAIVLQPGRTSEAIALNDILLPQPSTLVNQRLPALRGTDGMAQSCKSTHPSEQVM